MHRACMLGIFTVEFLVKVIFTVKFLLKATQIQACVKPRNKTLSFVVFTFWSQLCLCECNSCLMWEKMKSLYSCQFFDWLAISTLLRFSRCKFCSANSLLLTGRKDTLLLSHVPSPCKSWVRPTNILFQTCFNSRIAHFKFLTLQEGKKVHLVNNVVHYILIMHC